MNSSEPVAVSMRVGGGESDRTQVSRCDARFLAALFLTVFLGAGIGPLTCRANPPRQLTTDGREKRDPVFIEEGREIVFTVLEKPTQWSLIRLRVADLSMRRMHPDIAVSEYDASFSRDGRYYAYLHNDGNLRTKVVIHDPRESSTVRHDPKGGFVGVENVSIAPDGRCAIFAFPGKSSGQQIYLLPADGKNRQPLTESEYIDACPRFSADGERIAFTSTRSENFDIFVMNADGKQIRQLTRHLGYDDHPAWSADGRRIAFTSLRDGNYDVYVMDSDGSRLRRVTEHPERDDFASWHPDGKRLVVVSERRGKSDLYLVDAPE